MHGGPLLRPEDGLRHHRSRWRAVLDQRAIQRLAAFVRERGFTRLPNGRRTRGDRRKRSSRRQMVDDMREIALAALVGRAIALDEAAAQRDFVSQLPLPAASSCPMPAIQGT